MNKKKVPVAVIGETEPIVATAEPKTLPIADEPSPEVQKMQEAVATKIAEVAGKAEMEQALNAQPRTYRRGPKIGRNQPCPCGKLGPNGRPLKYKKCCLP